MSSQVKNLRAMFESKGETSPPDRGRSPGLPPSGADSPRPLSKVRTNFIAVEKDGRIGLQRDPSGDSVASRRKFSTGTEGETPPDLLEKTNPFSVRMDFEARKNLAKETIPESPRQDGPPATLRPTSTKAEAQGSIADKKVDAEESNAKLPPGDSKSKASVSRNGTLAQNRGRGENLNGAAVARDKSKATGKEPARTTANKLPAKVAPISTSAKATAKPAKSPTAVKTPTSATKPPAKLPSKTPEKVLHPVKPATPKTTASTPKATSATASAKKPAPIHMSPSSTGFVKPKPKSPTRPVKLPAGLTTHTAASVSKVSAPRQSLSRASGSFQTLHSMGRSPSRASVSTVGTGATGAGTKNLKRQSSVINRPRPSLGPPPKQPAKDHPPTRREKEVDEGFLARMMRPTQSFSSKTHEKLPTTPPRNTSAPAKKSVAKHTPKADAEKVMKRAASNVSEPEYDKTEKLVAEDIAPLAEQATSAEEVVEIAREAEGMVEPSPNPAMGANPTPEIKIEEPSLILEEEAKEDTQERDENEEVIEPEKDIEPAVVNGDHEGTESKTEADVEETSREEKSEIPVKINAEERATPDVEIEQHAVTGEPAKAADEENKAD